MPAQRTADQGPRDGETVSARPCWRGRAHGTRGALLGGDSSSTAQYSSVQYSLCGHAREKARTRARGERQIVDTLDWTPLDDRYDSIQLPAASYHQRRIFGMLYVNMQVEWPTCLWRRRICGNVSLSQPSTTRSLAG